MIYVLYNMKDVSDINYSEVMQTSRDTLKLSIDEKQTVLKFVGKTPKFLLGLTQYNHSEMLAIMNTPEWSTKQ